MTPLEAPTEDGGWMPEPGPPGELCSGKLGEFSQAFRADSIFGSKERRGMNVTRERRWQWVGLPAAASSQARAPRGPGRAQDWRYLQSEVGRGEGHLGEADGPLDVVISPQDGNALCQPGLEETGNHGTTGHRGSEATCQMPAGLVVCTKTQDEAASSRDQFISSKELPSRPPLTEAQESPPPTPPPPSSRDRHVPAT